MPGDGRLYVTFFNVGLGDSTLIVCPNGTHILIDAGTHKLRTPGDVDFDEGFNQRTEELRDFYAQQFQLLLQGNPIDVLVLTHPDSDHYNMIYRVLANIQVTKIYHSMPYGKYSYSTYATWKATGMYDPKTVEQLTIDEDSPMGKLICDGTKGEGPDCTFTAIASDVPGYTNKSADVKNSASVVIKCVFGNVTLLFMGDATVSTEDFLLEQYSPGGSEDDGSSDDDGSGDDGMSDDDGSGDDGMSDDDSDDGAEDEGGLSADILRVGHHGSPTSTSQAFLDAVRPSVAIVSCSRENRHGLPKAEVMDRLLRGSVSGTCERHTVGWYAGSKKTNPLPVTEDTTVYVWETGWNNTRTFGFDGVNEPWVVRNPD